MKSRHRRAVAVTALVLVGTGATAAATHLADELEGHTTVEKNIRPAGPGAGKDDFTFLTEGPGEPYVVREGKLAAAQADRHARRVSLAYVSQMTDFQLADEESPARVEFVDPGASSAHRPQEALTAFQVEATIRQINNFTAASPVAQGDGRRRPMDFGLLTGDQADNQHLNETEWVRDLLEGNGPLNFNSGETDPAAYTAASLSPSCLAYLAQFDGDARAAAAEAARYTGVQDYDDYPAAAPPMPLYYDPDEPMGRFAKWPRYPGLLDRAQQIEIDPEGLAVPFYITNGNHDVLVQGNEDANKAFEEIAVGCFKALGSTINPSAPVPDPDLLLSPLNVGMLVAPDDRRRFVSKVEIKALYGKTDEGAEDDDHGFAYVDPQENLESRGSASYYAWDPEQTPGLRFISIDTNSEGGQTAEGAGAGSSDGNLDDPQFQWLKRELRSAKERNQMVVIFGHHPVRSMNTQIRDEQAVPCTGRDDGHGHDVNPGCDIDPRPSDDDPDTPGFGCIHNGRDSDNTSCPPGTHESFVDLIDQFPNVISYVPGHTHEHRLTEFPRTDGSSWWEINTSAVIDYPNQSRLVEWMDNRDGTLSIFNTVVDHSAPITAPASCAAGAPPCAALFTEPELASIGRTLTFNDHQNDLSRRGGVGHRNAELLLRDPRPVSDLGVTLADNPDPVVVGRPVTYTATVGAGVADSHQTDVTGEVSPPATITGASAEGAVCTHTHRTFQCRFATIAAAQTGVVSVTAVSQEVGEITATVRVRGNVSDRQAANDVATQSTKVRAAPPAEESPTPVTPGPTTPDPAGTATGTATPVPGPSSTPAPGRPGGPAYPLPQPSCRRAAAFTRADAVPRGRGVQMRFGLSAGAGAARVDVFQSSRGRRVVGERLVARYSGRRGTFTFKGRSNRGRRIRDGYYFVRFRALDEDGLADVRRRVLRRSRGRWSRRPAFEKRASCALVRAFKLERPVFGGSSRRRLRASFSLGETAEVRVEVLRGRRVVKRFRQTARSGGVTHRVRVDRGLRRRGDYRVRVTAVSGYRRETRVLVSRRL